MEVLGLVRPGPARYRFLGQQRLPGHALTLNGIGSGRLPDEPTGDNVLKKAGIIVAVAATGVLAMSPLAFAGEGQHDGDKIDVKSKSCTVYQVDDQSGDNKGSGLLLGVGGSISILDNAFSNNCSPRAENGILNHLFG
jgi:hypothetical protein